MQQPVAHAAPQKKKAPASLFQAVWRWHFYAGIIVAPFLIILALSGAAYLFIPQLESFFYKDYFYVQETGETMLPASAIAGAAGSTLNEGVVRSIKFSDDPARTTEVAVADADGMRTLFVDPYSGEVAGSITAGERFTDIFVKIHSELLIGGTFANRLVELAACWTIIMIATGLIMWWPRGKFSVFGTFLPRLRKSKRLFRRDLHVVPAFWLSLSVLLLILSGLPWSGVMGEQINRFATATNTGAPAFAYTFAGAPPSVVTADQALDDIPWAAGKQEMPESEIPAASYIPLSFDDAHHKAEAMQFAKPYTITAPQGDDGVYSLSTNHVVPGSERVVHLDQYTGATLTEVKFADYGMNAKLITMGIALHEGRLFGVWNQILGLVTCLGLVFLIISSFIMWRKRKPQGKSGAPKRVKSKRMTIAVWSVMIIAGIIMPLVGLSLIVIFILDRLVFPRIPKVKEWIGA